MREFSGRQHTDSDSGRSVGDSIWWARAFGGCTCTALLTLGPLVLLCPLLLPLALLLSLLQLFAVYASVFDVAFCYHYCCCLCCCCCYTAASAAATLSPEHCVRSMDFCFCLWIWLSPSCFVLACMLTIHLGQERRCVMEICRPISQDLQTYFSSSNTPFILFVSMA